MGRLGHRSLQDPVDALPGNLETAGDLSGCQTLGDKPTQLLTSVRHRRAGEDDTPVERNIYARGRARRKQWPFGPEDWEATDLRAGAGRLRRASACCHFVKRLVFMLSTRVAVWLFAVLALTEACKKHVSPFLRNFAKLPPLNAGCAYSRVFLSLLAQYPSYALARFSCSL